MPEAVYRMMTLLCALVAPLPVGTNLGVLHLLWMLVSGQLLSTRGAVIPGLSACGLAPRAVRRAWAALGHGDWRSARLLARWQEVVAAEGRWQAHMHGGYHPVAVDVTAFWRPRLQDCLTSHYQAEAGRALPAIPVGLIGRVGSVGGQRLAQPLAYVRADAADPRSRTHERLLVRAAVQRCAQNEVLVFDAGFGLALLQEEGAPRFVVRCAKNATFRRRAAPAYQARVSGAWPPPDARADGAPAAAHLSRAHHPRHPAGPYGDLGGGRGCAARGGLDRPGAPGRRAGQR